MRSRIADPRVRPAALAAVDRVTRNADAARPEPNEHVVRYITGGGNPVSGRIRREQWDTLTPHQAGALNSASAAGSVPPRAIHFERRDRAGISVTSGGPGGPDAVRGGTHHAVFHFDKADNAPGVPAATRTRRLKAWAKANGHAVADDNHGIHVVVDPVPHPDPMSQAASTASHQAWLSERYGPTYRGGRRHETAAGYHGEAAMAHLIAADSAAEAGDLPREEAHRSQARAHAERMNYLTEEASERLR